MAAFHLRSPSGRETIELPYENLCDEKRPEWPLWVIVYPHDHAQLTSRVRRKAVETGYEVRLRG
jgi:hypothetical protein